MDKESEEQQRLRRQVRTSGVLLSISDTAKVLRVSSDTVRNMIATGELPAFQLGGLAGRPWRVSAATLNDLIRGWAERSARERAKSVEIERQPRGPQRLYPGIGPAEEPELLPGELRVTRRTEPRSGGIPVGRNPNKNRSISPDPVKRAPKPAAASRRTTPGALVATRTFEYRSESGDQVRIERGRTYVAPDHEAPRRFPSAFTPAPRRSQERER